MHIYMGYTKFNMHIVKERILLFIVFSHCSQDIFLFQNFFFQKWFYKNIFWIQNEFSIEEKTYIEGQYKGGVIKLFA